MTKPGPARSQTPAPQAQAQAYEAVNQVKLAGMQYRSDIGYRALIPTLNTTD